MKKAIAAAAIILISWTFLGASAPAEAHSPGKDLLTPEEREWLSRHDGKIVYAPLSAYHPIDFVDTDGIHKGIAAEYITLIEKRLGFTFKRVYYSHWNEILENTKKQNVDVVSSVQDTPERRRFLSFTKPFVTLPNTILTRTDVGGPLTLEKLEGMRVVAVKGTSLAGYLRRRYPGIVLETVKTGAEGLQMVSFNRADAIVIDFVFASYYAEKLGITNLRSAGLVDYKWHLAFASRKDWPVLSRILQKGLASISDEEREAIRGKWISVNWKDTLTAGGVSRTAVGVGFAVVLAVILGFFTWNRSLKAQVERRTSQLQEELAERKRAQEAMRESEEKSRNIIESIPVGMHMYQLGPDGGLVFTGANPTADKILGVDNRQFVGKTIEEAFPGLIDTEVPDIYRKIASGGPTWQTDQVVYDMGEIKGAFEVHAFQTSPGRMVAAFLDITERKRTEEELKAYHDRLEVLVKERTAELTGAVIESQTLNEQLSREIAERRRTEEELQEAKEAAETANRAKSAFLANMSHELRTPLNAVLGYTQILQRDPSATGGQRDRLKIIQKSGEHLLMLLNDILDLSKIEAGHMEMQTTEFQLNPFLESIVNIFRIQAREENIRFDYEPSRDLPTAVEGDDIRLRQVLFNLLGNAVKFTESGGVRFYVSREEDRFRFRVEDTGPGISGDDLEKIFSPFQQAGSRTGKKQGTGLGLPISKRLVEIMGGRLEVESTVGEGSVFRVELQLPAVDSWEGVATPVNIPPSGYRGPRRRVLVVDDSLLNRAIFIELLEPLGFEIFEAVDGREAVEKTGEIHPDVILMDLVMPVMGGSEAVRRIRELSLPHRVAIIAVSASVFGEDRQESLDAGCDIFIPKPFSENDFLAKMGRCLDLEWIYGEDGKSRPDEPGEVSEVIVPPPPDDLEVLVELAMAGNIRGLLECVAELARRDDRLGPFADELGGLAKRFRIDEIRVMLNDYRGGE